MKRTFDYRYIILIIATLILAVVPFVIDSFYVLSILTMANLYAVFVTSWDLVSGYTGNLVLGQALFIGIGAYSVGMFQDAVGLPFALLLGTVLAIVAALLVGGPSLKIRGPYFSLITMVLPLILYQLAYTFRGLTGGEYGLSVSHTFTRGQLFYITLMFMFICVAFLIYLTKSRIGKILLAIREDEYSCAALGNNVSFYKLFAFITSAVMSGFGGGLLAIYLRHVGPDAFDLWLSITILIMGIIGGIGTIIGPFIAAYGLTFVLEALRSTHHYQELIFAAILILAVLILPNGVIKVFDRIKTFKKAKRGNRGELFSSEKFNEEFRQSEGR